MLPIYFGDNKEEIDLDIMDEDPKEELDLDLEIMHLGDQFFGLDENGKDKLIGSMGFTRNCKRFIKFANARGIRTVKELVDNVGKLIDEYKIEHSLLEHHENHIREIVERYADLLQEN